jgi:flagellin
LIYRFLKVHPFFVDFSETNRASFYNFEDKSNDYCVNAVIVVQHNKSRTISWNCFLESDKEKKSIVSISATPKWFQEILEQTIAFFDNGKRLSNLFESEEEVEGLAIATRMTAQVRSQNIATRNASDGISLLDTAENALSSISDILHRMRELALQSNINNASEVNSELDALLSEANHISKFSSYNGIHLFVKDDVLRIHFSSNSFDTVSIQLHNLKIGEGLDLSGYNIIKIDKALDKISNLRAYYGAHKNRLEFILSNLNM